VRARSLTSHRSNTKNTMLKVTLSYDADLENPSENDGWTLYSFCRRHANFKDPEELGMGELDAGGMPKLFGAEGRKLKRKLENGLAHYLSYFQHGSCWWGRKDGAIPVGVEFRWDGVRIAGVLVWEHKASELGGKTFGERAKDAECFLKTYTAWANGEGFGYSIEDDHGNHFDSCYGFFDADSMFDQIRPHLDGQEYEVEGEARWLAEHHLSE